MRLNDSRRISSFSGGIVLGLLVISVTTASKSRNLCQIGSFIAEVIIFSWELDSTNWIVWWPPGWLAERTTKKFPNAANTIYIQANTLTMIWSNVQVI